MDLTELAKDVSRRFDVGARDLFDDWRAGYLWVDKEGLRQAGLSLGQISNFLTRYELGANVPRGKDVPNGYEARINEKILAAVWPTAQTERIADCVGS